MAYIAKEDFRTASLAEYCFGLDLTTNEASDALLTATIARMQQKVEEWCNDRFESLDNTAYSVSVSGKRTEHLYLPWRCRNVDSLTTLDENGVSTSETASTFRLRSSLDAGAARRLFDFDYLTVLDGSISTGAYWPEGTRTVSVTGDWHWSTTPADIKRAVALLCWDHFKPLRKDLRRVDSYRTNDASYDLASTQPSGIPEADEIIGSYTRPQVPTN